MGMKTEYEMDSLLRQIKQEGTMEEAAKRLSETLSEAALGPMQACLEKPSAQTFLALEETLARAALQTTGLLVAWVIVTLHQKHAWMERTIEEARSKEDSPPYRRQGQCPTRIRLLDGRLLSLLLIWPWTGRE